MTPADQVARLADACGLGGPALTVDTACSSFIYAVDLAQGLMDSGQAEQVVVMALNTLMPPPLYLGFSQLTAFSPRAQLQAFGAEAGGIVPGECAVAFLLEPLQRALEGARTPLGLMRALGLSADGAEGSVFTPGKQAQYTAYQRAWAGLDPASVGYIESHGTGTPLGDATEIGSLQRFFGPHVAGPIPLGSIKANIGHTLAAAGGPSLAKALLMLRHGTLPPQMAYPGSGKLADTCLRLVEGQPQALAAGEQPLRIGLSSFGFGGANAHMVVEAYRPTAAPVPAPARSEGPIRLDLMVVEAEAALAGGGSLAEFGQTLRQGPQAPLPFPQGRFGAQAPQVAVRAGQFLARDRVIDIDGYGMGPRPLAHVDPFKLLVTDRVGQLLKRLPGTAASDRTAMVMCCNLGGERFTNAYSEAERHYREGQGPAPGIEVADVASMLPSLLSGYPAKFFDLRGFHQTLAGGPGLFWHTLLAAPHWFERGIDTLLLGRAASSAAPASCSRWPTRRCPRARAWACWPCSATGPTAPRRPCCGSSQHCRAVPPPTASRRPSAWASPQAPACSSARCRPARQTTRCRHSPATWPKPRASPPCSRPCWANRASGWWRCATASGCSAGCRPSAWPPGRHRRPRPRHGRPSPCVSPSLTPPPRCSRRRRNCSPPSRAWRTAST